jgi:hypothetical protein
MRLTNPLDQVRQYKQKVTSIAELIPFEVEHSVVIRRPKVVKIYEKAPISRPFVSVDFNEMKYTY